MCIFHLILVGIPSILIFSVINGWGVGGFLLSRQNLLSITEIIFLTVTYHKQPLLDSELLPSHLSLLVGNLYISNTDKVSHFLMKYKFCNEQSTNINISKQSNIPVSLKHSFCFYLQHKMFFQTSFCIHLLLFVILLFCSPLIM